MIPTITSVEELNQLFHRGIQFIGQMNIPQGEFLIKNLPHGLFMARKGDEGEIVDFTFGRKLPKIEGSLLRDVITYFKSDLLVEACVRICYDVNIDKFFFVKAGGRRSGIHIDYDFSNSMSLLCRPGIIVVMDIHSHNMMPAFFSCVDDADELEHPAGLFGVIGRLQNDEPEVLVRACMNGSACDLEVEQIFDFSK